MKQLILCRHSKSESSDLPGPDRDRKLTPRGKQDALAIGEVLSERGFLPNAVLSSDSARTRQTTALVCEAFPVNPEITFLAELYSATGGTIMDVVATCAGGARTILVVGHNPGMEEAVWQLAGRNVRLSTSTVAVFEMDGDHTPGDAPLEGLQLLEVLGPPSHK